MANVVKREEQRQDLEKNLPGTNHVEEVLGHSRNIIKQLHFLP